MIKRLILLAALAGALSAQIITNGLVAQYPMVNASGTSLPDSSGNGNNGTLVGSPTVTTGGIVFNVNGSSQYASLPSGLSTTVKTIQIFTDCDRYLNNTTRAAILGNTSTTGLKIWCGDSANGTSNSGLDKFIDVDMATTLTTVGGINASATSFTVASTERLSTSNYFSIDAENIICSTITPPTNVSGCLRGQAGSSAASHSQGAGVFGRAVGNASTTNLRSYFNLISPSLYTFVADGTTSRALDNTTETLYGGFNANSGLPFTLSNNTGTWQLGGDTGEYFVGTIYYVLMYSTELTTAQITQNYNAVQQIVNNRGVPVRTDGSHNQSLVDVEGTSIEAYGWGIYLQSNLTFSPSVLVMAQPGVSYTGGILTYTQARDGSLPNVSAPRDIIVFGAPTNDFVTNTISTIETNYTSTLALAISQGWQQRYCGLMLSRTSSGGTPPGFGSFDAAKDAWNTWITANYQSIGCTALLTWDSRFTADGAYNNPNPTACSGGNCFSGDGVHPTTAGFQIMAGLAAPIINAGATNLPITVSGTSCSQQAGVSCTTQTQLMLQYTAPDSNACTITGQDNNGGPVVADLNPTLFTGANLDLSRTWANGFRWPTLTNGLARTAVIGGHDQIKKGTDGNSYSIALQANSNYTGTVSCDNGTVIGTWSTTTQNIPYASYYPELPIPDPTQVTMGIQPTVNWGYTGWQTIDPINGILMQRVSGPTDSMDPTNYAMVFPASSACGGTGCVIDVNGGAWTNPGNFTTNQVSGTLATTSTQNAPIFAALDPTFVPFCCGTAWTDWNVTPYGNASASSVTATFCPSTNSGQTCAVNAPQITNYATSIQAYSAIPSGYPSPAWTSWGGMNTWFGSEDMSNRTFTGVSCSGTPTVCSFSGSGAVGFNLTRTAGTSFYISSCSVGSQTKFTVSTVDSWQQITTQQSGGGTWTNCTYQDMAVGIRAVMSSTGTLNLSIKGLGASGYGGTSGSNGGRWLGGKAAVTNISVDCNGNPQSPALTGYLVSLVGDYGVYLIQSNGVSCLQSNLYNASLGVHLASPGIIPFLDSNCFILPDFSSNLWKVCHPSSNYKALTPTFPSSNSQDNFTWTNLGPLTGPGSITAQAIAAGGTVATALSSGLFGGLTLDTVGEDTSGNAIIQYRAQNGNDQECLIVWANASNTFISGFTMWGNYPMGWAACHFGGEQEANYSFVGSEAESSQMSPFYFNTTVPAGGPFVSRSSEGLYKNGSLTTWSIPISTCTNASPTVCTSTANDLDGWRQSNYSSTYGAWIQVSGGTGSWTIINGGVYAHYITNNTFSLYSDPQGATPINATSAGSFTGTVTATMLPPLWNIPITSLTGSNRLVLNLATGGLGRYFPSGNSPVRDGDPITITPTYLNSTTQYYAKVTGVPTGDVDVYTDAGLTTPATLSGVAGQYVTLAQTCPDPNTLSLPGPLYMDTGIGTTGAGNQKVRCVKVRLHDEGCSDFPATGEHATYPCASDASNTSRSSLHQIQVGDAFGDLTHFGNNHEVLFVLAVNRVSTNQIDVTLERSYGDDPNYGWRGVSNGFGDSYSLQHSPGWTPWAESPVPGGMIQTVASPTFAVPPLNGSHNDTVPGITSGNLTRASSYQGSAIGATIPDSVLNANIATFTGPATYTHQSFPFWSVLGNSSTLYAFNLADGQSYPSMRMIYGQAPNSEYNAAFSWNGDWSAMNGGFGNSQNNGDGTGLSRTIQNIRGTTYDLSSTTTIVYLLPTVQPGAVNVKIAPVLVTNWPSGVFVDMSGPGSLITDANQGSSCTAYANGECRPNSTAGQVFVAMRNYSDYDGGQCVSNNATFGVPCAFGLWPGGGWAVQVRNNPQDTTNTGVRRLTLGWTLPLSHYSFSNWISTPDAKWGFFAGNPIQQHPRHQDYTGTQWFLMKLLPTPTADAVNRTTYVNYPVTIIGCGGCTARVAFGYGENGNPANLYGTTRAETTYTTTGATTNNPFVFASESQGYASCTTTCTINVPAIPGRVLYYQTDVFNGTSHTLGVLTPTVVDGFAGSVMFAPGGVSRFGISQGGVRR